MAGGVVGVEVGAEMLHRGHEGRGGGVAQEAEGAAGDVACEVVDEE